MFDASEAIMPEEQDVKGDTCAFFWNLYMPYMGREAAFIEVRCLPLSAGGRPLQRWFPVTRFKDAACFAVAQSESWSVYVGVLPRTDGGGKAENLRECAWLWCDIDGGDGTIEEASALLLDAMQNKNIPPPHLIVVSGGGIHCYWRLALPVPCVTKEHHEGLRKVLRRLVMAIGGEAPGPHADIASTDPARILRVPGSWNHKQEVPRPVYLRCLRPDFEPQSLTWWEGVLPPLPHRAATRPQTNFKPDGELRLMPATMQKIMSAAADGSKHFTMRDVAVAARKMGFGDTEVYNFAEQVGWVSGLDMNSAQQSRHLQGLVDWVVRNVAPDPGG